MHFVRHHAVFVLLFALLLPAPSGAATADGVDDVLDEIFGSGDRARPTAPDPVWRPGHATVIWVDGAVDRPPALVEFDPTSGRRSTLIDATGWERAWGDRAGNAPDLESPVWRPDGNLFAIAGGEDPILYDLTTKTFEIIATPPGVEEHLEFSPDGRRIAWVRDNDLWIYDLALDREIRLSNDGSETIFNGVFDWVYTEELASRSGKAFSWSDDGRSIVWLRLDDHEIPPFHLVDHLETHTRTTELRYPKAGDPMPIPSIHAVVLDNESAPTQHRDWAFADPIPYIPRFGFTPGGDIWFQKLDRDQEVLELVEIGIAGEGESTLVVERDPYWIEPVDGLRFFDDGSILWLGRASGHMHLLRVGPGETRTDLSPGASDVTGLVGTDPEGRFAWYQAARPGPAERRLFRVDLQSGATVELTSRPGSHSAELRPASAKLLVRSSSLVSPPKWSVVDGDGASRAAVPVEVPIPRVDLASHRFVTVTAEDGVRLDAMLLLPPGFDETGRYPVVVFTYGGPNAQVVRNSWPRTSGFFNHALAGRGYVVFSLDNRGSAARGREFEGLTDHALGSKQLPDQLAGVAWLRQQPWVDPDRIAIWGWSYGGYMTAYALTHAPGVFAAGAAVAPVTDWRLYDSIYTERYMGTPESNPAGYAAGSVLDAVAELADPLLVIHGTGDDNVHMQNTLQLADRAWRAGTRFDLMLFPNLDHGINAPGSRLQVFTAIADFFEEHLMANQAEESE